MTEFTEKNGIVVPVQESIVERKGREFQPLELRDEKAREKAQEALALLWDAMRLIEGHHNRGLQLPDTPDVTQRAAYYQLHRHLGETLLGEGYIGGEEWT